MVTETLTSQPDRKQIVVAGVRNSPRLWRIPIPRLSNTAVPIKISRAWLPLAVMVRGIPEAIPT